MSFLMLSVVHAWISQADSFLQVMSQRNGFANNVTNKVQFTGT